MELDEAQAQAIATWSRFDADVTDELLRAVAGAFAAIACADGELAQSEVDRFVETVISSDALPKVDAGRLEASFRDLCQAIFTDFEEGRRRALDAVERVKGDPQKAELVVRAGQIAVVADERLQPPEETALREICERLGLDPELY
ncbi:MAG: TerB family tellurite resistance protein [Myxococcota bacterium]